MEAKADAVEGEVFAGTLGDLGEKLSTLHRANSSGGYSKKAQAHIGDGLQRSFGFRFRGRSGDDQFVFTPNHGDDTIDDFTDGEDLLVLVGLGITKAQALAAASEKKPVSNGRER